LKRRAAAPKLFAPCLGVAPNSGLTRKRGKLADKPTA
jgi:hypothetical protein